MKKIIPILLCVLLIGALALSVSAAGSSVALTPSATTLERGDTFTIVADLTNSDAIKLGTVALSFDESVFELTGGTCHVTGANPAVVLPAQKVGTFFLGSETVVSGKIFTFNFKVKDNASLGTYTFTPTAAIGTSTGTEIESTGTKITIACNHNFGAWTKVDDSKHQRVCNKCQTPEVDEHDWNDGIGNPAPGCETPGTIEYTCLICQAPKAENVDPVGHKYDNNCDDTCNNNCGTTREVSHNYSTTYSSDETGHWYACSICKDKKNFAAHTPGAAATEKAGQTCTICNFEIAPALAHVHDFSDIWYYDSEYHWHRCEKKNPTCYQVRDKAKHDYDDACDVDCNTCGAIRVPPHSHNEEWQGSEEGHWHLCTLCGSKTEVESHVPGPEATDTEPQRCEECNFIIQMELSHTHDFGENWYSDDESHWQCCTDSKCTETSPMEPHNWDEGVELADGSMQYTCAICAKQVVSDGPMATEPTQPSTQAPATQKPTNTTSSGGFPWAWAGIAAVVLLVIGIALLVIEFVRSRKYNSHGKFSK